MSTLFFSYSHKDEKLRDQLEVHLAMLKREGVIEAWHDRKIPVGDEIDSSIDDQLEAAAVILLLVSADFLASSYCYDREVRRAMQRHKDRTARVIPVILRPCDWKKAPFGKLLAAPEDGKPVTKWLHRDDAYLDIVQRIRVAVSKLASSEVAEARTPKGAHDDLVATEAQGGSHEDAGEIEASAEGATKLAKPSEDARPNPEPLEMQTVHSHRNYVSPRLGLLSTNTWTLAATVRNLLLNWPKSIPLFAAFLMIPWIYLAILMKDPPPYTFFPFWLGVGCIVVSVAYMGINLPSRGIAQWRLGKFLLFCLLPLFFGAACLTTFWAWFTYYGRETPSLPLLPGLGLGPNRLSVFLWLGVVIHLLAWILSVVRGHGFRLLEFPTVIATGAIGGTLLGIAAIKLFPQPLKVAELYACFAIPLFLGILIAFAGLSGRWRGDDDGEWWAGTNGWLLILAVGWSVVSGLVVFGPFLLGWVNAIMVGVVAGAFTVFGGRSNALPANENEGGKMRLLALLFSKASSFAAIVFVAALAIFIIIVTIWLVQAIAPNVGVIWSLEEVSYVLGRVVPYINVLLYTPWWLVTAVAVTLAAIGLLLGLSSGPRRRLSASRRENDTSKV